MVPHVKASDLVSDIGVWEIEATHLDDYIDLSGSFTAIFKSQIVLEDETAIADVMSELYSNICRL